MKNRNTIQSNIWHYPNSPGAFFTQAEYSHYHFRPHFHHHYVFFCVARGVNEGSLYKKKYTITPGDFLVIHPGEIHSGNSFSNRPLKYYTFCPTEKFLLAALDNFELTSLPSFSPIMSNAKAIIQKFNLLIKNAAEPGTLLLEQSLTDFLGTLMETSGKKKIYDDSINIYKEKVVKAKKFIEENYTDDFSLEALAQHTGLSTYYLLRLFKSAVGLTPYDYLYNFRVEMAKQKIRTNVSLTQLAHQSGFYDQSHFIKHFKKINGTVPSTFKN